MNTEVTFESLNLSSGVLKAIEEMGFESPSSIQSAAIPLIMKGEDVIAQAQTGTGKTAAFGIPVAEIVDPTNRNVQAIIITPTRELCIQVAGEISKLCRHKRIRELPIYGGQSYDMQFKALRQGVHVVVGTPGRVIDHIKRGTLKLNDVKIAILDEADEMLDMGFIDDIEQILKETSTDRQTMLFSATMPMAIKTLAKKYMKSPQIVAITPQQVTVNLIEQYYYEVKEKYRFDSLCRILETEHAESAMVFCRTKRNVDELVEGMQSMGYSVEGLHGDMTQSHRTNVMNKFKSGVLDFLVATDVAARGLDIESVTHVINYNIPEDPESYVHRIGRTGRAGREGTAITLITAREMRMLRIIEQFTRSKIKRKDVPTLKDIHEQLTTKTVEKLVNTITEGNFSEYKPIILNLADEYDLVDIAASAFKYIADLEHGKLSVMEEHEQEKEPETVRLFINIGRKDKVMPADIVRSIADVSGLPGSIVGVIDILDSYSFVEVQRDHADAVMKSMKTIKIKGRKINMEKANRNQNQGQRRPRY